MPRIFKLLIAAILFSTSVKAERILETVLDPANPQHQNVKYRNRVLIAGHTDSFMLRYNDIDFARLLYPIVAGTRLRFDSHNNPLTIFEAAVYFALSPTPGSFDTRYLYRYAGGGFARVVIPGNIISNTIVYGGNMYFLSNVSGSKRLYRHSGGVTSEVAGAAIPNSVGYELNVAGDYLYISGYAGPAGTSNFIRRYNGAGFITLPWTGTGTVPEQIFAVPGTNRVYFTSHERILYYNGLTVRQVFFNTGEAVFARMWRSELYFTTGIGTDLSRTTHLFRLTGATLSEIALPAGYQVAPVPHTNPEVHAGSLFIGAVRSTGTAHVLRYDGITFTTFFNSPTSSVHTGIALYRREGKLMIHPNFVNGTSAYEYDGTTFEEIRAPEGRLLFPYINSTDCNHLWLNYYTDESGIKWAYAKESKDCVSPPPAGAPVIPDHFMDYERFEMTTYGPDRGWCWSEIIIDWEIVPVCELPPCPLPQYETRMTDANNGVQWFEQFNKPSQFKVPLPDDQPFTTVLTSIDTKQDLLVFEPDLVPAGIEGIKINMRPKQGGFELTARTRNDKEVPLQVTLLNADGKVLWEKTFTAPFSEKILDRVQEPGKKLIFSIPKLITKTKVSGGGGR